MTTARDIMHAGAGCIGEYETLAQAARQMRDLDVGALPICDDDGRLTGIITDRDIVIRCMAEDHRIRRLPVTGSHGLVGMITEADVARNLPDASVAEFVEAICADF